jgi:hypothetical protein
VDTVSITGAVDAVTGNELLQLGGNMVFVGLPSIDTSPLYIVPYQDTTTGWVLAKEVVPGADDVGLMSVNFDVKFL